MDVYFIDTPKVQRQVESLHLQMKDIEVHSFKGLDKQRYQREHVSTLRRVSKLYLLNIYQLQKG